MKAYRKPQESLISFMSNKVREYGGINLAQGLPGFAPPQELLDILSEKVQRDVHQYAPSSGDSRLLNLLCDHYTSYGSFTTDNLLITNGATEAISLLYVYLTTLLEKPFATLAFEPVYESYSHLPQIFGSDFIPFPLNEQFSVDFETLADTVTRANVKIVFICSPGNPLGKIWTESELDALMQLAGEKEIYVIFDGVYKDIYFTDPPPLPLNHLGKRLFYVHSFSKMLSITGWRVGYLIADAGHVQKIRYIHDYTGLSAPSLLQQAISQYLHSRDFGKRYLDNLRKELKKSHDAMQSVLRASNFFIPETEGGYFVWAELPAAFEDGFIFALDLYDQEKVAVVPGIHFSKSAKRFIRINIARDKSEIIQAAARIERFLQSAQP
jgi:aspartate/methionine/tyrosine aminotransferase